MVRTWHFAVGGLGSIPGLELKILQAIQCSPPKGESLLHLIHCSQTLVYSENLHSAFQLYLNVYSLFFFF